MIKGFKIINYSIINDKVKKKELKQENKTQLKLKAEKLENRVKELEIQLFRIFQLIETLDSLDDNLLLSHLESPFYNRNVTMELKAYLKWVLEMFKYRNMNETNNSTYLINQNVTLKRKLHLIEESLSKQFLSSDFTSLRNRTGRGAEHVGNSPTAFDYGSFLETSIHLHDCFAYGSGFHFKPKEIVIYIKQSNPGFMSKTLMASLTFKYISLPGDDFNEIRQNILNSILPLISQACYNPSFESLKALSVLHDVFIIQNNYQLSHQLLGSLMRMSYLLGIDKLKLNTKELYSKSKEEIRHLINLKKIWAWIVVSSKISEDFYGTFPLIKEYDLSESEFLYYLIREQFDESDNQRNDCKKVFAMYDNQIMMTNSLVFDHLEKSLKGVTDLKSIPYSSLILPTDKFNLVQNFINKYYKASIKSLNSIITNSNKAINLDHYLCVFPSTYCCIYKGIHEIRKTLSIYIRQLCLIYPTVSKAPIQVDIPLMYIPTLLETSLRILFIYRVLAFTYFEDKLKQINIYSLQNEKLYKTLVEYLDTRLHPINNYNKYDCLIIMSILNFEYPLYSFYSFLQILSSPTILGLGLISNEAIDTIETNIIELLQIYKLAMNLTKDKDRMDIDFTVAKVKLAINTFGLPEKYKVMFNSILN
ncbi:hypothetical protein K502DRAFT_328039 [Neoconidiobolus thromboides FSU 785]|nr:hypothetical protein K502DRAFT_328039 [Neoconidiobolus thromboides FSU 785]